MSHPDTEFSDTDYVADELKKVHKPLFLCSLYFREEKQSAARAVLLFFEEVRKIPDTISEPMLGEMRTTWWRELIEKGNFDTAGSPLARELITVIRTQGLNKNLFYTLLDGITADIYVQLYENQAQVEDYYKATTGNLFKILASLNDKSQSKVCVQAGLAYGRALHLYETPKHLQRHKIYWPQDVMSENKVTAQMVLEQKMTPALSTLLAEQIDQILHDLDNTNGLISELSDTQKSAFAPLALIRPWIKAIRKTKNNVGEITPVSALGFQWHLWTCGKKGKF